MSSAEDHSGSQVVSEIRTQLGKTRLSVTTLKQKADTSQLLGKYDLSKYKLTPKDFLFDESLNRLIPSGIPDYIDRGEQYLARIARALFHFKQCALIGPSGTGKTHIVYLLAEIMNIPLWEVNCGLQTSAYDLFGRFIGLGRENWVDGQIVAWARNGGILYLDEANMMRQDVAARLNPILDTRGHLVLTEKDNEVVERDRLSYCIISMNPASAEFSGAKPLNAAFRRRMSVWIDFDYLSVAPNISKDEIELVQKRSNVEYDTIVNMVKVAAELRRQYKQGDLPYGPSVGDLLNWATLIADNTPPMEAAEETIVAMTSDLPEVQESVKRVIKMVF